MLVAEAAASDLLGLIFTFVWDFDAREDREFLDGLRDIMSEHGGEMFYADLQAGLEERKQRVDTENRLRHKPKRDVAAMRASLLRDEENQRMDSGGNFPYPERHIRVDNTFLSAEEAARRIAEAFGFGEHA